MVAHRFSCLVRIFYLPLYLLVIPLSAYPSSADSDFFSPAQNLQKVEVSRASEINLPLLRSDTSFNTDNSSVKVRLVHFWASWCVPCREEFPALQRLYHDYRDKGLEVLAIAADNEKSVSEYIEKYQIKLPVMIDQYGKAMFDYKVKVLPTTYLIDEHGMIRYSANGHVRWDSKEVRVIFDKMITR
jgi:thiol-disulfide isomerase/thioredoxin